MSDRRKKHYLKQLKEQTIKIEKSKGKKSNKTQNREGWNENKRNNGRKTDIKQLFFLKSSFKILEREKKKCLQLHGLLFLVKEEKMNG